MKRPYSLLSLSLILCLLAAVIYQHFLIVDLDNRLQALHEWSDRDSFSYRISNVEHIVNAHSVRLRGHDDMLWEQERKLSDLSWRATRLEWAHPADTPFVLPPNRDTGEPVTDFDADPGRVPKPSGIKGEAEESILPELKYHFYR